MLNRLLKDNIVYAIGNVSSCAASLLIVPYLAKMHTFADFGVWILLEIENLVLGLFILAARIIRAHWSSRWITARSRFIDDECLLLKNLIWL